jgi:hypothetical protein
MPRGAKSHLGLSEITGTYGSERGQPPFDPTMMTALLLYSYCCGIYSSRRIAKPFGPLLYTISIWALPAIIAITFHEAAHGFAARLLGDDTAWRLVRVTFNPLKHIGTPGQGARAAR